jgi:hypothetical protein
MRARRPTHAYTDPLDLIWIRTAERIGWRVTRSDEVYAAYDGNGTLTICNPANFDPDDCMAQYILHEICHALVAGPEGCKIENFGLDNTSEAHLLWEQATHRLQAELTRRYGLRGMLRPNSEYRYYFDSLPELPLFDDGDPAVPLAREGAERAEANPWREALGDALSATRSLVEAASEFAPEGNLFHLNAAPKFRVERRTSYEEYRCEDCAWHTPHETQHCHRHPHHGKRELSALLVEGGACRHFQGRLSPRDCGACGACCREGVHLVEVGADEVIARTHAQLLVVDEHGRHLPRPGGSCPLLDGGTGTPWRCREYSDRPRSCRDFEIGGAACLEARRRVGLSP